MAAGLPGTGIGGLFFILSAFFMIIVELQRTVRGKSSLARWRIVGRHAGVAAAMVASVTAAIWLVHRLLFTTTSRSGNAGGSTSSSLAHEIVPFSPVLITLAVLMLVLLTSYLAKFVFSRRTTPVSPDASGRTPQPTARATAAPVLATQSSSKP
jgi:chromate transport protein ChrA